MSEIVSHACPECAYCRYKADDGCAPQETESTNEIMQFDGFDLYYTCDITVSYTCTTLDLKEAQENTESAIANLKALSTDIPQTGMRQ